MRVRSLEATLTAVLLGATVILVATWAAAAAEPSAAAVARRGSLPSGRAAHPAGTSGGASPAGAPAASPPRPLAYRSARAKVQATRMVAIPAGSYLPLYTDGGRTDERKDVRAFRLDEHAVTRAQFAAFVAEHPEWRRSQVQQAPGGAGYLAGWRGDVDYGEVADGERPVTQVSLPAARAYCAAEGKRLPTTDEWEYAAAAGPTRRDASRDPLFRQRLLELYTRPRPPQPSEIRSGFRNVYGVWDLHGIVWEWTAPVAPQPMEGMHMHDVRHRSGKHDLGCAGGAAGASDTRDYPSFLRYAFRSALTPTSTSINLGFRCAS